MVSFRLCMKEDFQNKNMSFSPTWAEAPLCDYLPILCSIVHPGKLEFVQSTSDMINWTVLSNSNHTPFDYLPIPHLL